MFSSSAQRGAICLLLLCHFQGVSTASDTLVSINLDKATALSLANSPKIKSIEQEIEAQKAKAKQAYVLSNPELEIEFEDINNQNSVDDSSSLESTISIAQKIELGGKRKTRKNVQLTKVKIIENKLALEKQKIIEKVRLAFEYILAYQEKRKLFQELEALTKEEIKIVAARVRMGKVTSIDKDRAEVNLEKLKMGYEENETVLKKYVQQLKSQINRPLSLHTNFEGSFYQLPRLESAETYLNKYKNGLAIQSMLSEKQYSDALLQHELSNRYPDYKVGAGLQMLSENNRKLFLLNFSIDLPLFNRNKDQIQASKNTIRSVEEKNKYRQLLYVNAINELLDKAKVYAGKIEASKEKIIPKSKLIYETIKKGYEEGKNDFLDMLEANKSLIESKQQHILYILQYKEAIWKLSTLTI